MSVLTQEQMQDIMDKSAKDRRFHPIDFNDPVEMLFTIDKRLQGPKPEIVLYPWQISCNKLFAQKFYTVKHPLRFLLRASNGSGKDSMVLAPTAVWQILTSIRSRYIITSSSFNQLKNQTEPSIRSICNMFNNWYGEELLYMRQFHVVAKNTGAEILMFATDDAGLAEGYHPFPDHSGAEMTLAVNEAKTVLDEIFGALKRCTGFNRHMEVSSPGSMSGHFYHKVKDSTQYPDLYVPNKTVWYSRKVTSYDCPHHVDPQTIEDDKKELGENDPLFRSMHLAEFTSNTEEIVVPLEFIIRCIDKAPEKNLKGRIIVGADLSAGGDEVAMYCLKGNTLVESFYCRIRDTVILTDLLDNKLKEWQARHGTIESGNISMDDGHVGKGIIDNLIHKGWTDIRRCNNQSPALNKLRFLNRGAELWWTARDAIERCVINLECRDEKLIQQLASRYYTRPAISGKIRLESKKEARANGHGSPDRGDAFCLVMNGLTANYFEEYVNPKKEEDEPNKRPRFTMKQIGDNPDVVFERKEKFIPRGSGRISLLNILRFGKNST